MSDTLTSCKNLLAGRALFTITHETERYTFKFHIARNGRNKGICVAYLLTGPNNDADYTRLGKVNTETGDLELDGNIGTGKEVPVSAALARWIAKLAVQGQDTPTDLTIHHAGSCLRCGRTLTVPYPDNPYRIYGLGPECGAK